MLTIQQAIDRIHGGADLAREESADAAAAILQEEMQDSVVAEFLVALAEKGETGDEIAGFASVLMNHAARVDASEGCVDLCGTGGSGRPRFNVSTAAAFVVSACGVPVAKHGNRGSRQPNGSFDLLEALELPLEMAAQQASDCLESMDLAFLYARQYHPIMKNVVAARKLAARRTIFNLVGPLCNPAKIGFQVIGTSDPVLMRSLGDALKSLGRIRSLVVCGDPGIDEISISGATRMLEIRPESMISSTISPDELGIMCVPYEEIPAGPAAFNAAIFRALLANEAADSTRDMVALNAGAALYVCGHCLTLRDGYLEARESIADGRVKAKFDEYKAYADSHHIRG